MPRRQLGAILQNEYGENTANVVLYRLGADEVTLPISGWKIRD